MNKKVFIYLMILCLGIIPITSATEISRQDAEKVAKNFFYELTANQDLSYYQIEIAEAFTTFKNGEAVYYAFNFENGGFVIVAADDTYYPIIGYSDKYSFKEEGAPENFTAWMNNYAENILLAKNSKTPSQYLDQWNHLLSNDIENLSKGTRDEVVYLDAALWNQDSPYNYYAPATPNGSGPDGKCYAGCVATAMEMCMYYWRWPFVGEGSKSYNSSYGTLSANFANSYYNWHGTVYNPGSNFYHEISYLMYHAGVSVEMNFHPEGSGAFSADGVNAMKNYFKYAPNASQQQRGNTTTWINLLKEELNNGRMLYYSGSDNDGGHAFICDGYNTDDYFHFNFGWSGTDNGYYSVQTGPNGFAYNQAIFKNLQPNPNKGYPYYCEGHTDVPFLNGSVEDGSGPLEDYQNNASASWLIDPTLAGDSTNTITITWRKLYLASGDYLKFYDGVDENAPFLRSFTENSLPESFTTSSGRVYVTFTSDGSTTADGFHFEFKSSGKKYCSGNNMVNDFSGIITDGSPEDMNYGGGTSCTYIFNNNKDINWINFKFNRCRLAAGDRIVFRIENTVINTIEGIYDLELPEFLIENIGNDRVSFTFSSDGKLNEKGWEIEYTTSKTAVEEYEAVSNLNVYPNPTSDFIKVNFEAERSNFVEINVYTITGQSLYSNTLTNFYGNYNNSIDVSNFAKGIYLLSVRTDKGVSTRKIVVQ